VDTIQVSGFSFRVHQLVFKLQAIEVWGSGSGLKVLVMLFYVLRFMVQGSQFRDFYCNASVCKGQREPVSCVDESNGGKPFLVETERANRIQMERTRRGAQTVRLTFMTMVPSLTSITFTDRTALCSPIVFIHR